MQLTRIYTHLVLVFVLFCACRKHEPYKPWVHGTDSLQQSIYSVARSTSASGQGYILVAPFGTPDTPARVMLMDGDGHLLKEKIIGKTVLDFKRWNNDGIVRYTWQEQDATLYPGSQAGTIVIADSNLNEIRRVRLMAHGSITDPDKTGIDGHDFIMLDDNHYLAMAYLRQRVTNVPASFGTGGNAYVVNPVIQEVQNGQVVWQWEGASYPEFYSTSVQGNNFTNQTAVQDYMHINSMFIDLMDGNLICSFRNTDQVIKISRKNGDIIWRLGGKNSDFALTAEMRFIRQHNATMVDGGKTLLLFDNGDLALRPYSRILEFQLHEASRSITSYKSYNVPGPLARVMSSVQKIGDHYFIGGGSGNFVLEINYRTGEKVLEMTAKVPTYRAYKF